MCLILNQLLKSQTMGTCGCCSTPAIGVCLIEAEFRLPKAHAPSQIKHPSRIAQIMEDMRQLLNTGTCARLDKLRADLPVSRCRWGGLITGIWADIACLWPCAYTPWTSCTNLMLRPCVSPQLPWAPHLHLFLQVPTCIGRAAGRADGVMLWHE